MVKRGRELRAKNIGSRTELVIGDLVVFFVRGVAVAYQNPTGVYINELLCNRDPVTRRQVNIWRDFTLHKPLPPDVFVTGLAVTMRQAITAYEQGLSRHASQQH